MSSSPKRQSTAGSTFAPEDHHILFIAADPNSLSIARKVNGHLLFSLAGWGQNGDVVLAGWLDAGAKVFIDSGIFTITMQHARKHGTSMDEALALAPDQIDGFDELHAGYLDVIGRFGDRLWGYVELDQGGRENKIATRAKLEAQGLAPIPVYHPFNDGWDYFDYLAERYDRICLGNIVGASTPARSAILYTIAERRKKHPGLKWIHGLGLGVTPLCVSPGIDSCDASSWLASSRWGADATKEYAYCTSVGGMNDRYMYNLDAHRDADDGHAKSRRLAGYQYAMIERNLLALQGERDEAGL